MNKFMRIWEKLDMWWWETRHNPALRALIIFAIVLVAIGILVGAGFLGQGPFLVVAVFYLLVTLYLYIFYMVKL